MCKFSLNMSVAEKMGVFFVLLAIIIFSVMHWDKSDRVLSVLDGIKKPEWLGGVSATTVNNEEELDNLWRSKKRCCLESEVIADNRAFYKACTDAIARNPNDESLVVKCLWLMPVADSDNRIDVYRLLLSRYPNHKASVRDCVNCNSGDVIARATQEVAVYDSMSPDKLESAIEMLEKVLEKRGSDTSTWVKLEIYRDLGGMYLRSGVTEQRKQRLNDAYKEFEGIRTDESLSGRIDDFEKLLLKVNGISQPVDGSPIR